MKANSAPPVDLRVLAALRFVVALVWLYEGLWRKILAPAPHEVAVVKAFVFGGLSPIALMALIGAGETLLGLGLLSGLWHRFVAAFAAALLIVMNVIGILFSGAIADPLGLVIHNLPLLACTLLIYFYGPGAYALQTGKRPQN
jgi:uncharacterized membrane protein YphA (DoxX/SURF4 family)